MVSVSGFVLGAKVQLQAWRFTLDFDGQTANFTVGQVVTGGTSGATGLILSQVDAGLTGTLTLTTVSGTFQDNEGITDPLGGAAKVNGTQTLSVTQTARGKIVDIIAATKKLGIHLETDWDDKLHGMGYGQSTLAAFLKAEHATVYQSEQLVYGDATPTP